MNKQYTILSAPLQGYTDNVWRNAHATTMGGIDTYCAPFMRIDHGSIRRRDINDIDMNNNDVPALLPQLLANKPDEAVILTNTIKEMGYSRIDINLGCPHPPVANKHKGAGLLKYPDELEAMLRELSTIDGVQYSVKMRLGWDDNSQWEQVLPLLEIIEPTHVAVHPRLGTQQYKGELDMESFARIAAVSPYPIIYNGGIESFNDITKITEEFGNVTGVMIGRGLVARPYILDASKKNMLDEFHDMLVDGYAERLDGGDAQLVNKMKSLWEVFLPQADRKARKAIKKAHNMAQYNEAARWAIDSVLDNED